MSAIKDFIQYLSSSLDIDSGWVAVMLAAVIVIAVVIMFGKNIRWRR